MTATGCLFQKIKGYDAVRVTDAASSLRRRRLLRGRTYAVRRRVPVRHLGYICRTAEWIEPDVFTLVAEVP